MRCPTELQTLWVESSGKRSIGIGDEDFEIFRIQLIEAISG